MKPTAYILEGDPRELEKVIRENRIRINRGVISFAPVEPDSEQPIEALDKGETDNNSGENIPVTGNIDGENIPQQPEEVEIENDTEYPETLDDKTPQVDDVKEIDLEADVKETETNDTKDVPAADAKEVKAPRKTSKTKKSE